MKPKLAFVSIWDAADPGAESGYAYSMRRQLRKYFDVADVFPLELKGAAAWMPFRIGCRAMGRYYHPMREPSVLNSLSRQIEDVLTSVKPDIVFSPSSIPMSYVKPRCAWVYAADQLFCDFLGSYIKRPSDRFRRIGEAQERIAIEGAARATYPSYWAADSAVQRYGAKSDQVSVMPWGANLPSEPPQEDIARSITERSFDICRLVFIGRDWQRKGGEHFVGIVRALNARGVRAHGTIIGADPKGLPDGLFTAYPHLDKTRPDHFAIFAKTMLDAHFLLAPSRAEAYGQALCEAMAFGVPVAASAVGGIPTILNGQQTGILMRPDATPEEFASRIENVFCAPELYRRMAAAARDDYRERLNWDCFGADLRDLLMALI